MNPLLIIIFNFIVGTGSLMLGVNLMSSGLENANLRNIKEALSRFTGKLPTSFITGTAITALVQSSTAVTVMTVGFVNSGLMELPQAIGIIYGANIGTTITAQLMSFKLANIALPVLISGSAIRIFSKRKTVKNISTAVMGFGFMFLGLSILNLGVPYIKGSQVTFHLFKTYGSNLILGIMLGMITTMLVHSSSATVGLTIVLFNSGLITFEAAIGLTLGDNIGTCITAQLASLGTTIAARRTAWAHTLYNIIGVFIALVFLIPFMEVVKYVTSLISQDNSRLIANAHTIFNILSAVVFLPFTKQYVKFIEWVVKK